MKIIRKILLPLLPLLFSAVAFGQSTVTVTANLKTIFAANQATKAKACFTLVDASTGQAVADPHVIGTGVLVATDNICIAPDANGLISTTMYANSAIVVQGAADTTYWSVQYLYNGSPTHGALYHFAGAEISEDLSTKSPANLTPSVTPTPTDGTYMRVDAGNSPATGTWQFPGLVVTGATTLANTTLGAASTLTVANIKQIANTAFLVSDGLGVTRFLVSSTSPYANTFISGNGAGSVFLGSGSKTSVDDVTGNVTMSGSSSGTTVIKPSAVASGTLTLPAATDTLVGKATTDTLTNKTLTGQIADTINQPAATAFTIKDNQGGTRLSIPSGGVAQGQINNTALTGTSTSNSVNLFASGCPPQGPTSSINGTGAAADIFTCALPVNVVESNKILHVICSGVHDTGTVGVTLTMNINGQNIVTGNTGTTASQSWSMEAYVLRTGTTTGQAWGMANMNTNNNGTMAAFSVALTGLSWTSGTQTLNCQFNVAAGDHITGRVWAPMSIQ